MWVFSGYWDQCSRLLCSDCDCHLNLAGSKVDGAAGSHYICLSVIRPCKDQNSRRDPGVFPGSCRQGKAHQQERAERQGSYAGLRGGNVISLSEITLQVVYQLINQWVRIVFKKNPNPFLPRLLVEVNMKIELSRYFQQDVDVNAILFKVKWR